MNKKSPKTNIVRWHEIFTSLLFLFFTFFVLTISRCSFELKPSTPDGVLTDVICFVYAILALIRFLAGLFVCLLGIEQRRKEKRSSMFFKLVIVFYAAGVLFIFL